MKKLNKEEMIVGFVYGSCVWPLISWWAIIPGVICSFLWAIGGSGPKMVRRIGVPVVVGMSMAVSNLWQSAWLLITAGPLMGIVSIGYGMPSDETDKGSWLGRFYSRFMAKQAANWATRFTIFVMFNIVIIIALAIVKPH